MKIFLLAGSRKDSICKYLTDKGVEVEQAVENLTENFITQIIDVDKFVIIDTDFDIATNMNLFLKLLQYPFFNCKELVFMGSTKRNTVEFFRMAIEKSTVKYPTRVTVEEVLPLNAIYLTVYNISREQELKENVYQNVYREPYESKVLITEDETEAVVSDKDFSDLNKYEQMKKQLLFSKDFEVRDKGEEPEVQSLVPDEDEFEEMIELPDKSSNVVMISGESKSGKTVLAVSLLSSVLKMDKKILIIDCQRSSSTVKMIEHYYDIDTLNLLDCKNNFRAMKEYLTDEDSIVSMINMNTDLVDHDIVIMTLARLKDYYDLYDLVLIDAPIFQNKYLSLFKQAQKVLITTSQRIIDIDSLKEVFEEVPVKDNITFVLSKVYNHIDDVLEYTVDDIIEIFEKLLNDFDITNPFEYTGLSAPSAFGVKLLGGIIKDDSSNKK